jgi:aromatic ring-opening dioxygenase LigB subunit
MLGSFILPHGALVLDPHHDLNLRSKDGVDDRPLQNATELHNACTNAAQRIADLDPDLIILTTPHGISLEEDFGIYLNNEAKGTAEWREEYTSFTAHVTIDTSASKALIKYLKDSNNKQAMRVQGIISFTSSEPAPLRWGEAIPLYFVDTLQKSSKKPKYIIITMPARRVNAHEMTSELHELGRQIHHFISSDSTVCSQKTVFVVSGDLAHTHTVSPHLSIGYYPSPSETAQQFDNAIQKWIETGESKYLIEDARSVLTQALSCGYTGFVIVSTIIVLLTF